APVNAAGPAIPVAAPTLDDNADGPAVRTVAASLDGTAEGPATRAFATRDEEGIRWAHAVTYVTPGRRAARLARGGGAGRTEQAARGRPHGAGTGQAARSRHRAGREVATAVRPAQRGGPG